jgi:quercetin dioxygenase-like cupin family protein
MSNPTAAKREFPMNPPAAVVLGDTEGEALWFNNDLLIFKATGEQTGGAFLLLEELAGRGKATPLHTHPSEEESFYFLEGEALVQIDGVEHACGPGGFICIPRGIPHAYTITSETARTLILVTPGDGGMEAFFREAGEPAPQRALPVPGPLDLERIGAAAELTGAVKILGPPPFARAEPPKDGSNAS